MAGAFNLTAQLNLRGPANVGAVVANIRKQLGSINATVNVQINPTTTRNIGQLNGALRNWGTGVLCRHSPCPSVGLWVLVLPPMRINSAA